MSPGRLGKTVIQASRLRRFVGLLLVGLLVAACQNGGQRDERLVRFVDEIMFGGPIDDHVPKDGGVVRWRGAVTVAMTGSDIEAYRPRVLAQIEQFSRLSGLNVRMADAAHSANLEILLVKTDDFLVNREHAPCFASVNAEFGQIVAAEVHISTANADLFDACLSHELMHAFGFLYHSGIVRSALSPAHEAAELTPWDELALRVLYDSRLKSDAGRADADIVIRQIVSELMARS